MKRLVILIFSIVMAGEMTVDGNLIVADTIYVTTIQSATIDSLLSLIAQLEMRIAQLECQNTGIIPDGYCDCFFHTLDECGVCNGDTTSCADCADVPNGDNTEDNCGICDNDSSNDCAQDCNGEWGGTAEYDVCGICGGDIIDEVDCPNYALEFDEDYYVFIGLPNGMSPTGSHTIMFKAENHRTENNKCDFGMIIGADMDGDPHTNNNLHYGFRGCEPLCQAGQCMGMDYYSNQLFADSYFSNEETHWVLAWDVDTHIRTIYQNGQEVAKDSESQDEYNGDFKLIIGGTGGNGNVSLSFKGVVDDFSVWSKALTMDEVSLYFESQPIGNEDNLEVLYNFDEGTGLILNDSSGNGNHGTIYGKPVWVERE